MCRCGCCENTTRSRRGGGIVKFLFNTLLLYVLLIVGGGTLMNTGHPVAVEVGQIMHLVTFVEPTIYWADSSGLEPVASSLRLLAGGVPIPPVVIS